MMATVPHVTSGLGLRKFQAGGFLLTRVYVNSKVSKKAATFSFGLEGSVCLRYDSTCSGR